MGREWDTKQVKQIGVEGQEPPCWGQGGYQGVTVGTWPMKDKP